VLAAQQADQGSELKLRALFAGFDRAPRALLNVGMLYLALLLLAMMLLSAAMPLLGLQLIASQNAQELPRLEGPVGLFMLLSATLMFLLSLCYWFAPALVVLNGQGPWQALRDSFRGGIANWQAVLLCLHAGRAVVSGLVAAGAGLVAVVSGAVCHCLHRLERPVRAAGGGRSPAPAQ
jgi:hypothetical protein